MKSETIELFNHYYQEFINVHKNGSIHRLLQVAAQSFGSNTALIYKERGISYQELYARAALLSDKLRAHGVKPRDNVLLCADNSIEFYISYFAIWQAGAIVIPLNIFLKETELNHILHDAKPVLMIIDTRHYPLFKSCGVADTLLITTEDIDLHKPISETVPVDEIVDNANPDEMVALLYTSGTTGVPKGVMLSAKNIITNLCQLRCRIEINSSERVFAILPLFHVFAQVTCVWASIFVGATIIIVPKIERAALLQGLQHKPTIFLGVPALYGLLCLLRTAPLESVKYFICGGDALPDKIRMMFALLYRRKICNGYGLTETSPVIAADLEDTLEPTNTVGKPLVAIACNIVNPTKQEGLLPAGSLSIKGDNVMVGYYNSPETTAQVMHEGWLDTGDAAYFTAEGKLVISGREKDLIIHKGFNIYPQEIENVILAHPQVLRAAVIGKKDETVGEYPIAFVQMRVVTAQSTTELKKLCTDRLAAYKVPRNFICDTKELPLTATGKVNKMVLAKLKN